MRNNRKKI